MVGLSAAAPYSRPPRQPKAKLHGALRLGGPCKICSRLALAGTRGQQRGGCQAAGPLRGGLQPLRQLREGPLGQLRQVPHRPEVGALQQLTPQPRSRHEPVHLPPPIEHPSIQRRAEWGIWASQPAITSSALTMQTWSRSGKDSHT